MVKRQNITARSEQVKHTLIFIVALLFSSNISAATVFATKSGAPIKQENIQQQPQPIASITKLMSAIVILDSGMDLTKVYQISSADVDTYKHSRSRLSVGTKLTGHILLHLALMSSDNRAIHALMRNYPGGFEKGIEQMNITAKQFGMFDTKFVDPTGLYPQNVSTPHDLSLLVTRASDYKLIREYSTTKSKVVKVNGRHLTYLNSNRLIRSGKWKDVITSKTGFINEAGMCLVMAVKRGNDYYTIVVLDAYSNNNRFMLAENARKRF